MNWLWRPTSPRDESQPSIAPLRNTYPTTQTLDDDAATRRETTKALFLQGIEARVQVMAPLSLPASQVHDEEKFGQRDPGFATGASTGGIATGTTAMKSDTVSKEAEIHRTHIHVHDTQHRTAEGEGEAREDQSQLSGHSLTGKMPISKGWGQLRIKQRNLQAIRVLYEEQRERLWREHDGMCAIDAQFLRKLQKVEFIALEDLRDFVAEILRHSEILEQARYAVALEQAAYQTIERELVEKERELRDLEYHMYRHAKRHSVATVERQGEHILAGEEVPESVASSQNIRRNQSSEAQRYLSQKGDVDILRERLLDLRIYRSEVIAEQGDRRDAGLDPDEILTAFLNGFDQQHEELVSRLRDAEEKLANYEEDLQVPEDSYYASEGLSNAQSLFGMENYADDDVIAANELEDDRLAATAKVFLLPPSESKSVYSLLEIEPKGTVEKALSVNAWLLHRLRTSADEMALLMAEHMTCGLQLEPADFKQQVLANWLQDGTARALDFSRFAVESHDYTMATISGHTQNSRPRSGNILQSDQQKNSSLQGRTQQTPTAQ